MRPTRTPASGATTARRAAQTFTRRLAPSWGIRPCRHTRGCRRMTDSRVIDRESRRFIREELLTNLLVEAGAGSGKTQMLADRMAAGIASGVYQVANMAAVTFTRKAASELRGRLNLALEKRLEHAESEESARLRSALANLERFF